MYKRKKLHCLVAAAGLLRDKSLPQDDRTSTKDPKAKVVQVEKISPEEQERLADDF